MSKFANASNTQARSPRAATKPKTPAIVQNAAGGKAFALSPKLELVSYVLSSMLSGDMYRKGDEVLNKIRGLVTTIEDKEFIAKAALYARNEFGMRSTSHVLAGEMANINATSGTEWGRDFYNAIVYRVDDMMEILGYYMQKNPGKPLPNALKAGFAEAFKRFDAYQLAKYRGESNAVKLVDVVRLVRPKPTKKNADALAKLLKGELKNTQTWEAKISAAGQQKNSDEQAAARNEAWADLLKENKLGYLALVRNLTNIAKDADDATFELALKALVNTDAIKKSLIFPFQLYTAYKEVESNGRIGKANRIAKIMDALSQALDISCANVPEMPGKTLVAIDISGSMTSPVSTMNKASCVDIATLFGVILAKANDADVIRFQSSAEYTPVLKSRSTLDTVKMLARTTGGTNFESIFNLITKDKVKYDRIFILSDMMAWMQTNWSPKTMVSKYKAIVGADPFIYSMDLAGNGTTQFAEDGKVCMLSGFSEKVFDLMKTAEQDKNVLLQAIENYPIQVARSKKE